jgi:malate dehydrogenase (oxaloacetate-decarboxylating)
VKVPEIFQVETPHTPGGLVSVLHVIAEADLVLEHVSTVRRDQDRTLWEITVEIDESAHADLVARLNAVPAARFVGWSDRVLDRHRGGKIEMRSRVAISTQQILRDIYTPGVARVCPALRSAPEKAFDFTYLGRAVAIVTDGSAIPGLGNVGARAALPVIEGKARQHQWHSDPRRQCLGRSLCGRCVLDRTLLRGHSAGEHQRAPLL